MKRLPFDVDYDMEKGLQKVFYSLEDQNYRTILEIKPYQDENGNIKLPDGCHSKGFVERISDGTYWEEHEWLPNEKGLSLGLHICVEAVNAYKDNQKKRDFLKK